MATTQRSLLPSAKRRNTNKQSIRKPCFGKKVISSVRRMQKKRQVPEPIQQNRPSKKAKKGIAWPTDALADGDPDLKRFHVFGRPHSRKYPWMKADHDKVHSIYLQPAVLERIMHVASDPLGVYRVMCQVNKYYHRQFRPYALIIRIDCRDGENARPLGSFYMGCLWVEFQGLEYVRMHLADMFVTGIIQFSAVLVKRDGTCRRLKSWKPRHHTIFYRHHYYRDWYKGSILGFRMTIEGTALRSIKLFPADGKRMTQEGGTWWKS